MCDAVRTGVEWGVVVGGVGGFRKWLAVCASLWDLQSFCKLRRLCAVSLFD